MSRNPSPVERRARLRREQLDVDMRTLLDTAAGRRLVWALLGDEFTHIDEMSFNPGSDPRAHVFREGERNVGLKLRSRLLTVHMDGYALMEKEGRAERKRDLDLIQDEEKKHGRRRTRDDRDDGPGDD